MNKSAEKSEQRQVSPQETEKIIHLANKILLLRVEGDFVELGCYKGETSVLLQKLLVSKPIPERTLYLYDSFAGLPEKSSEDASSAGAAFKAGELYVSKREVIDRFRRANLPLPVIKKAFFSDLALKDLPEKIAFAFLDGDLYSSIVDSLRLVVPRLVRKGIIVVHDYNNPELPGVSRAVDEFLKTSPDFSLKNQFSLAILEH
ncbi:class I SAM-dependent methyltransferase [Candidatus Saccharibacteria bacterium]|nr:class I SAM-dependent methyltransferase [Candidatus Saccharibacteria bacterium]